MKISCKHCFFYAGEDDLSPGCVLVDPLPDDCDYGNDLNCYNYE